MIDTHAHLDGPEFSEDLPEVLARARQGGVERIFVPATDVASSRRIIALCREHVDYLYPMLGLHPEEVHSDYDAQLEEIYSIIRDSLAYGDHVLAIGEIGLDFYWSREFEAEQIEVFRRQVEWSIEFGLPIMVHCRKAQNELVKVLKDYKGELVGGVFHCFTGNEKEAMELLSFPNFVLGIGGVFTFKKSPLPEVLPRVVSIHRIVLETDSPYMAPTPMRGSRNESAYVRFVLEQLAKAYGMSVEEVERVTNETCRRIFSYQSSPC